MKKIYFLLILCISTNVFSQFNYQRAWATYFGGKDFTLTSSKTDKLGNIYMVGFVISDFSNNLNYYNQFTTTGAHQESLYGYYTGVIAKFSMEGALIWSTYLGSTNDVNNFSLIYALGIDSNNDIYIGGEIYPSEPTSNLPIGSYTCEGIITKPTEFMFGGGYYGFVTKLSSSGVLQWGEFVAGTVDQIEFDSNNNIYIAGFTRQTSNIATVGAFQENFLISSFPNTDSTNQFIAKYDSQGTKIWGTYYGLNTPYQNRYDGSHRISIALDNIGNLYVAGNQHKYSNGYYATQGCFQNDANFDPIITKNSGFISKFNPNGNRIWSTYYGLTNDESTTSIRSMAYENGFLYIAGVTNSNSNITTTGSYQPIKSGLPFSTNDSDYNKIDGFLTKFDINGNRIWGTYFGGELEERLNKIVVKNNLINIAGETNSVSGISSTDAYQTFITSPSTSNNEDAFDTYFAQFTTDGVKNWSSYYGGGRSESCESFVGFSYVGSSYFLLGENDTFFVIGTTQSDDGIATSNGHQPIRNIGFSNDIDSKNMFLAKFEPILNVNQNQINNLQLNPNPNKGYFTITGDLKEKYNEINITVVDIQGRTVFVKTLNNVFTINEVINLQNTLQNGIYFVKLNSELKNLKTFKVLID